MHNGVGVRFGKPTRRRGSKFPIIMVIIIIILALLAGIYFVHGIFFNNRDEGKPEDPAVTEQVQPEPENIPAQPTVKEPEPKDETENSDETENEESTKEPVEDEDSTDNNSETKPEKADTDEGTSSSDTVEPPSVEASSDNAQ